MKTILVEELKPGMKFSRPVYIDSSNMLVNANVPIKEDDIKRLMKWGISEISTQGELLTGSTDGETHINSEQFNQILDDYNTLISLKEPLLTLHDKVTKEVVKIHNAVKNDRIFHIQDLSKSVEEMYNLIKKNRNVFLFLQRSDNVQDTMAVHSVNAAFYSMVIGLALKYNRARVKDLGLGVLLINAGMIQLPTYIINKEGNLSDNEFNQIRSHPILGYQAMKKLGNISEEIAVISLQHHEEFNGGGYPKKLRGIEISEYARIATVADNYEAMLEKKAYRPRNYFYQSMKQLVATGARKFDPVILRVFISVLSVYPIGSLVQLNNKKSGVVIGTFKENPMRPVIKLIRDEQNHRIKGVEIVNLVEEQELYITQTIDERAAGINMAEVF